MNRSRKSVSQTPVQKTTLLSFFERTPSSTNKQSQCESSLKNTHVTPSTSIQTPGSTPFLFRARPREIDCPACKKTVKYYSLNEHLDSDCVPSDVPETKPFPIKQEQQNNFTNIQNVTDIKANEPKEAIGYQTCEFVDTVTNLTEICSLSVTYAKPEHTPVKTVKEGVTLKSNQSSVKTLTKEFTAISTKYKRQWHTSPKKSSSQQIHLKDNGFVSDTKILIEERNSVNNYSGVKKRLTFQDVDGSSPQSSSSKRRYAMPYYLETFLFLINSAFNEPLYKHLYIDEDLEAHSKFLSLSLDAKKLYVRLFSRKFQWRRSSKIVYNDIADDLSPLLNELCRSGFLLDISHLNDLDTLLKLLSQPEIKELFKELKVPFNGKLNAVEIINKHCRSQRSLFSSAQSITDRIIGKIKRQVSECYILSEEIRRIFLRFIMLSTLHHRQEDEEERGQQQQSFIMLKVTIGEKSFPSYAINRQRKIFKDRDHFLRYGEAVILESQVRECYDLKRWDSLVKLTDPVEETMFDDHYELYGGNDLQLPLFLRRFTAGSVYVYIFNRRIEALQAMKMYKEAVDLLYKLIKQGVYLLTHRGHWYERLALNVEQHLKDPVKAMEIIKDGLSDTWVTPSHKLALSQRATRISQSAKWRQKCESFLNELTLLTPSEPRSVTITGRSLPRDLPGRKSVFIRGDSDVNMDDGNITLCSVEELVLQHYLENGYTHGVHGEGSTLWTVVGLLFWDVIYSCEVPDAFLSPFQVFPLDFDSLNFYESRKSEIEKRLDTLRNCSSKELVNQISEVWNSNHGKTSLVSWERFSDVKSAGELIECIPPKCLAAISERLLRNYRHFRSGFPDLTVWNPQEKKMRIVEVKGPNDRLSTKQILWLDFLVNLGLEAEVCYVEAVGTKQIGSTPQVSKRANAVKSPAGSQVTKKEKPVKSPDGKKSKMTRISKPKESLESEEFEDGSSSKSAKSPKKKEANSVRKTKTSRSPEEDDSKEQNIRRSQRKRPKTDSA